MNYYYSRDGESVGPLSKDDLARVGIAPDTLVWTEGMKLWVAASEVPMLADILDGTYNPGSAVQGDTFCGSVANRAVRPAPPKRFQFAKENPSNKPVTPQSFAPASLSWQQIDTHVQYWAVIRGIKVGPMFIEDMEAAGVKDETLVWRDGMVQWQSAATLPELREFLSTSHTAPPAMGDTNQFSSNSGLQTPPPQYNQPVNASNTEYKNYTTASVFAIVLGAIGLIFAISGMTWNLLLAGGALICGILGCVKSSEGNVFLRNGNMSDAVASAKSAKAMCTVAFILAGIGILLPIILIIFFGVAVAFAGIAASSM